VENCWPPGLRLPGAQLIHLKVIPLDGARLVNISSNRDDAMYKNILVPLDGSDTARRGLEAAIELAKAVKAKLTLLNVTSDFPIMVEMAHTMNVEQVRAGLNQYGRNLLEETKAEVARAGIEVATEIRDLKGGRVADTIVAEANASKCDLIVIGTHGRRGFSRALMGSDAERVVRESSVPVLVVRASQAAD
jgi:nucleotide-binding universal stress UspA family protein